LNTRRDPATITFNEAVELLRQAEDYAQSGDISSLCNMSDAVQACLEEFSRLEGKAAIPSDSPTIVKTYVLPDVLLDNGNTLLGGRVLVIQGVDGRGHSYRTEWLVFDRGNNKLTPRTPIYWSRISIVTPQNAADPFK